VLKILYNLVGSPRLQHVEPIGKSGTDAHSQILDSKTSTCLNRRAKAGYGKHNTGYGKPNTGYGKPNTGYGKPISKEVCRTVTVLCQARAVVC
jgi:hypothetical protein